MTPRDPEREIEEIDLVASDEPDHDHGPLLDEPQRPAAVWTRRVIPIPRRRRAPKGWRLHLRRSKALARSGRAGA